MADLTNDNTLVERHYVTLIVRLLVDQHGQMINGEMVDVTDRFRKHFVDEQGLIGGVHTWLTQQERGSDGPQFLSEGTDHP
jgi:hypothetical protein